jgi:hypothetical protein
LGCQDLPELLPAPLVHLVADYSADVVFAVGQMVDVALPRWLFQFPRSSAHRTYPK